MAHIIRYVCRLSFALSSAHLLSTANRSLLLIPSHALASPQSLNSKASFYKHTHSTSFHKPQRNTTTMPTTEIAVVSLTPGTAIGDPSDPGAIVLQDVATTLHQQPGVQAIHFGTQVESPETLQLLVTWSSLADHETFRASESFGPYLQRCAQIMAGPADIAHVDFGPDGEALSKALSAPVTEIATLYYEGQPGANWSGDMVKVGEVIEKAAEGFLGAAYGVTHEEVEYQGVKGKAAMLAVGWTSVEAHQKFHETETFRENIGLVRGEAKGVEMHHVVLMRALE